MGTVTGEPVCEQCGKQHVDGRWGRGASCTGHKRSGVPCSRAPMTGQKVCASHGGRSPQAIAAAAARTAAASAEATVRKLIPDNPEPIRDPIGVLARLAGEADSVRSTVVTLINKLKESDLYSADKQGVNQVHALVALYDRWWTNTAKACEALVRSNYLERHAAIEEAHILALLAVVQRGLELVPDLELRRAINDEIGAGLKALPAAS